MTNALLVAVLMKMASAVNAGDAKGYAKLYQQDAVIHIIGTGDLSGRDAIERHEVDLIREFPGTRLAFYSAWRQGRVAVVRYAVNGQAAQGHPMGHEGLLFFRFDDAGLITDERRYLDALTPMAQLGALGSTRGRVPPVLPDRLEVTDAASNPEAPVIVRRLLRICDAHDAPAFAASLTEDVVIDELMLSEPFTRADGARQWLEMWARAVPDGKTEITNVISVGDAVLVEATTRGTLKGALGPLTGNDVPFSVHRAFVMEFAGQRLARLSAFMNAKELAEATGQWPLRSK